MIIRWPWRRRERNLKNSDMWFVLIYLMCSFCAPILSVCMELLPTKILGSTLDARVEFVDASLMPPTVQLASRNIRCIKCA